jgi:hypothetical protein
MVGPQLLPYVLSVPQTCSCGDSWLILIDEPRTLEVELGLEGQSHLALLVAAIEKNCANHGEVKHLRTDGQTVWMPE